MKKNIDDINTHIPVYNTENHSFSKIDFNKIYPNMTSEEIIGRRFLKELSFAILKFFTDGLMIDEIDEVLPKIEKFLLICNISEILYSQETGTLLITTDSPGRLIGSKGKLLSYIDNHFKEFSLRENLNYSKIEFKEDKYPLKDDLLCALRYYYLSKNTEYRYGEAY